MVSTALTLALAAAVIWPLARVIDALFSPGAAGGSGFPLARALTAPGMAQVLLNTVILVVSTVGISLVVGGGFAWLNERTDARMGWISDNIAIVPLLLPPVASVIGWVFLLSPAPGLANLAIRHVLGWVGVHQAAGPLNIYSWYGVIGVSSLELIPFAYLTISAGLRNLDPALEEASRLSGAGVFRTFWKVTVPSIGSAAASGLFLVVSASVAVFTAPEIIGTPADINVLSTHIFNLVYVASPPQTAEAAALGAVVVAALALLYLSTSLWQRRGAVRVVGGRASQFTRVQLGPWKYAARASMVLFLLGACVLPLLALLAVSLQPFWSGSFSRLGLGNYRNLFSTGVTLAPTGPALINSYELAAVAASVGVMAVALVFEGLRRANPLLRQGVQALFRLPAGIPQVVLTIGILLAYSAAPLRLAGTKLILLIAYLILYLPQTALAVSSTSGQVSDDLVDASAVSGSSMSRTFLRIVTPLTLPGLAAAWALLFALVIGDVAGSSLLAGPNTPVIGAVTLNLISTGTYPQTAALMVLLGVSTSAVILIARVSASRYTSRRR